MANFETVMPLLTQGESVRRADWEPFIRMFVSREILMCQCGTSLPTRYTLSWDELSATDWHADTATYPTVSWDHVASSAQPFPHSDNAIDSGMALERAIPKYRIFLSSFLSGVASDLLRVPSRTSSTSIPSE